MRLLKDPVPYVKAMPLPTNILTWHYIVTGPENTPYQGMCIATKQSIDQQQQQQTTQQLNK